MPKELFTAQTPPDFDEARRVRREALEKAKDEGLLTVKRDESQWLSEQAVEAAETGTHTIPDISARRAEGLGDPALLEAAAQTPDAAKHAAHVAVEQAQAGEKIVPVTIDRSDAPH